MNKYAKLLSVCDRFYKSANIQGNAQLIAKERGRQDGLNGLAMREFGNIYYKAGYEQGASERKNNEQKKEEDKKKKADDDEISAEVEASERRRGYNDGLSGKLPTEHGRLYLQEYHKGLEQKNSKFPAAKVRSGAGAGSGGPARQAPNPTSDASGANPTQSPNAGPGKSPPSTELSQQDNTDLLIGKAIGRLYGSE